MQSDVSRLSNEEIKVILREADAIIAQGRRRFVLRSKGAGEKKILQLGLDRCPVYGYFKSEKLDDIMQKIDWMIDHDIIEI